MFRLICSPKRMFQVLRDAERGLRFPRVSLGLQQKYVFQDLKLELETNTALTSVSSTGFMVLFLFEQSRKQAHRRKRQHQ
ncbi:MAG: hypothetical protein CMR00_03330 [[Chlorobium] sp. 445]|nr:MAG: hypothetical protein CMR00_03330 [[Chlorobium] sp. 445]